MKSLCNRNSLANGTFRGLGAILLFSLALSLAPSVSAQELASDELRDWVAESFDALPLREGWLLRPLDPAPGVRFLELSNGGYSVGGEVVDLEDLESLLGEEQAEYLEELAGMDSRELESILSNLDDGRDRVRVLSLEEEIEAQEAELEEAIERERGRLEEEVIRDHERTQRQIAREHERAREQLERERERIERTIRQSQRHQEGRLAFGSSVVVDEDETVQEAVAIGGSVVVKGRVLDAVVAVGGRAEIIGEVEGDVVAVGGPVILRSGSSTGGDIFSFGGTVRREDDVHVGGTTSEVSLAGSFLRSFRESLGEELEESITVSDRFTSNVREDAGEVIFHTLWLIVLFLSGRSCGWWRGGLSNGLWQPLQMSHSSPDFWASRYSCSSCP